MLLAIQKPFFALKKLKVGTSSHQWSIIVGNVLEHFDSSLYGFLAPLIGKSFFPDFSDLYQIILAYSVYLITFIARPLGGIFFSKLSYQFGAFKSLYWTLMGVAFSTGLMGCLPNAYQIGLLAPCLLVGVRFLQSFCAAGESAIAGYYLIEAVSENKQLPWAGVYQCSTALGILIASAVSSGLMFSYAGEELWRVPFLAGFGLGLWGLWMRFNYRNPKDLPFLSLHKSIFTRLKLNWRFVVYLIPIYGLSYVTYSVPFVFLNPFLSKVTPFGLSDLMIQSHSLLWLDAMLLPLIAFFVPRIEWHKTLTGCALLFALSASFLFLFIPHISYFMVFFFRLFMVIGGVGFTAALLPWTARLYPPEEKYLLHSVSYNIASEFLGRSAPAICLWLYALSGHASSPLIYILGLVFLSLGLICWIQHNPLGKGCIP